MHSKVLLIGLSILLIAGLFLGGCTPKEMTPPTPSTTEPSPLVPAPDKPAAVLPDVLYSGPWPPIIDAHAHLAVTPSSEQKAYIDELVVEMDRLGVVKATLEGLPTNRTPKHDEDILAAYNRYPDRFYPYLSGFNPQDEGAIDYVRKQLETGQWKGLGEIYLRHSDAPTENPADHPVMLEIYDLCAEYNVPIHIHFESDYGIDYDQGIAEIKRALSHNPNTIFIWAHKCHGNMHLMDEFPNLYTEGCYRQPAPMSEMLKNRFMFGSDVGLVGVKLCGGGNYDEEIDCLRERLSSLDEEVARNIAYKNVARLMKDDLIIQELSRTSPSTLTTLIALPEPASAPPRPDTPFVHKEEEALLFQDDFKDGIADGWALQPGWDVSQEDDNYVLTGCEHSFARPDVSGWSDYTIEAKFKLDKGNFHFNLRENHYAGYIRYFLGVNTGRLYLNKQITSDFFDLSQSNVSLKLNQWHTIKAVLEGNNIKVYLDGTLAINYTDSDIPILSGIFSFETLDNAITHFDDISVTGTKTVQRTSWVKTGGPSGGLGYDVRINPLDKNIMFVTDNPSGVNKSYDGGNNWVQSNMGITARTGTSGDGVPIFCLTIDPGNPDIVWTGTQSMRGIYKSVDGGETWTKKDNGITEWNEITFRNFGVHPQNSDIVFAGAEIRTGIQGREFDKAKGKIYKTEDGGENWRCVWEGGSLARFALFDPTNPNTMYASTGIFDRDAYNDAGEGVLKSTDGGETWRQINNGLDNLFVGFLEMHPEDPRTLFAAVGNNTYRDGSGVYRTTNGGENWTLVLPTAPSASTVVTISPSHPEVVYAGGADAFYRSDDGGENWQKFWRRAEHCWGPPGVRAGFPISAVVDPDDPMTVFANNYGGGVFKSVNGAETWIDCSTGYTGADLHHVVVTSDNPDVVYTIGRSGPFRSLNRGGEWDGMATSPAAFAEWNAVVVNPENPREVLIADEFEGSLLRSTDGGSTWEMAFQHPKARGGGSSNRHGFKAIAYAPSDPDIVYAGMRKGRRTIEGNFYVGPSLGIYKSVDGGKTWHEKNNGLETADKNTNAIVVHPHDPDIAYAATWRDGIFKTTDGGESWVAINNGLLSLDVRSLAIDPENPDVVYAGMAEGVGIFKTTNGGELWEAINAGIQVECPSFLQRVGQVQPGVSLEKPKRIIGGEYYSIPWTNISSIVIDPVEPQTLYAADLHLGVYMSTDGGASWTPINDGLSTKAVSALALSADGRVLYAATSGEGVFRLELW